MILITGATGNVGRATAQSLLSLGKPVRVAVREPSKLPSSIADSAEVVTADLGRSEDLAHALSGVTKALLVTPNGEGQEQLERGFIEQAAAANVAHVTKISSMEAAPDVRSAIPRSHYRSEEYLRASGMDWTMLRPSFFMQNLLIWSTAIREQGCFALPLGDAQTSLIDARDVGKAAASSLSSDTHRNRTYELTGPELMTFDEVAAVITEQTGKTVRYLAQSSDEFRALLERIVPSTWQVDALVALFAQIADGALARRSGDYRALTGASATRLSQFVADYAGALRG